MASVACYLIRCETTQVTRTELSKEIIKLGKYMNDKVFQIWHQKREQGFFSWLSKSTLGSFAFYLVFSIAFQYSSIGEQGIASFVKSQWVNYVLFTGLMIVANGLLWLYRESSYKKEACRRNIM